MAALTAPFDVPQKLGFEFRIQQSATKIYRGGAVGVIIGTGYATPLVPATAGMQFIGVSQETSDNTNGVAGTIVYDPINLKNSFIRIQRMGIFAFNQSGITQASVGLPVYFSDDNTVTLTAGAILAGTIVAIDEANTVAWVDIENATLSTSRAGLQAISASGAVAPRVAANYVITKAGVAALTLAAPTSGTDDGLQIVITSGTAFAHTLTATGLLNTGSASVNVATFAAFAGAGLTLVAYAGKWNVLSSTGITFT